LFLAETITNPLARVGLLDEAVAFGRREGLLTVIDNTFATPVHFRPLSAGFDLCFHSATKYLGGHSDVVAGCVMGSTGLVERVRRALNHFGGSLDPHTGFLLARGVKTLAVRVQGPQRQRHGTGPLARRPPCGRCRGRLAKPLLGRVRLAYPAVSLGCVETLIIQRAVTAHDGMRPEDRERLGIGPDLVRVSCGIEAAQDLIADFSQALAGL
jgi:cystathionine gamma-synthase/cystathionine gamma-lyase/cystathionine beta-lyase